jgi:murein tripeptide amidase MpaA
MGCAALALALAAEPATAQSGVDLSALKTRPERTEYRETSRYEDVIAFLEAVDRASPLIHLTTFGYTFEGRALPLVVVGHVKDASPEAVLASGKTRVYIQGDIHAGEVEGKEATQILLREIAQGQHKEWLDSLVLLVKPIFNADGNERITLTNRGGQQADRRHGPAPNAQGDLNRDHQARGRPRLVAGAALPALTAHALDLRTTSRSRHALSPDVRPAAPRTPTRRIDGLLRGGCRR